MYPVFLEPNDVCMQLGACAIKVINNLFCSDLNLYSFVIITTWLYIWISYIFIVMQTLTGEPTCDECVGSVQAVAGLIGSEEKIAEVIAFLDVRSFLLSTTAFIILEISSLIFFSSNSHLFTLLGWWFLWHQPWPSHLRDCYWCHHALCHACPCWCSFWRRCWILLWAFKHWNLLLNHCKLIILISSCIHLYISMINKNKK